MSRKAFRQGKKIQTGYIRINSGTQKREENSSMTPLSW